MPEATIELLRSSAVIVIESLNCELPRPAAPAPPMGDAGAAGVAGRGLLLPKVDREFVIPDPVRVPCVELRPVVWPGVEREAAEVVPDTKLLSTEVRSVALACWI